MNTSHSSQSRPHLRRFAIVFMCTSALSLLLSYVAFGTSTRGIFSSQEQAAQLMQSTQSAQAIQAIQLAQGSGAERVPNYVEQNPQLSPIDDLLPPPLEAPTTDQGSGFPTTEEVLGLPTTDAAPGAMPPTLDFDNGSYNAQDLTPTSPAPKEFDRNTPSRKSATLNNPIGTTNGTLAEFLDMLIGVIIMIGSIVIVLSIIYAGFKYIMAQGDIKQIQAAHSQLLWTAIGAAILLGARVIAMVIKNTVSSLSS